MFHQLLELAPAAGWQIVQEQNAVRVYLADVQADFISERLAPPLVDVRSVRALARGANGKAPLIRAWRDRGQAEAPAPPATVR